MLSVALVLFLRFLQAFINAFSDVIHDLEPGGSAFDGDLHLASEFDLVLDRVTGFDAIGTVRVHDLDFGVLTLGEYPYDVATIGLDQVVSRFAFTWTF